MGDLKKISGKELANAIGKTPPAITYMKKQNQTEFMLLKLGFLCNKLDLDEDDLIAMYKLKRIKLRGKELNEI
jgi:DNA-binding Xre family transcriptional regulator